MGKGEHETGYQSMRWSRLGVAIGSLVALLAGPFSGAISAAASESTEGGHSPQHAAEHTHHRHHVSAFLGGGVRSEEGHTVGGGAIGLDYEYRVIDWLGAGVLVEMSAGDLREAIVIFPVALHPWRGAKLVLAPGVEIPKEHPSEFLFRLGLGYNFPVGDFTLGPEVNFDFADGETTYVLGVAFGIGF